MISNLTRFNDQINDFMLKLINIFPEEKSILVYYNKFQLLRKINPRKVYEGISQYIYPYKEQIMSKNDDFFINLLDKNRDEINSQDSLLSFIDFHKLWKTDISDDVRDNIWQYFQVLCILTEHIIQEKK
jgi:hypothetical protein